MEDGYFIPKNYEDNMITGSGRSMRNVVEAVIFFAIFVLILASCQFLSRRESS